MNFTISLCQTFPDFPSPHVLIVATTDVVYPIRQHSIPRSLPAVLRLVPPFPSRSGGPSGLTFVAFIYQVELKFNARLARRSKTKSWFYPGP